MKKDIPELKVEDVAIAIVPRADSVGEEDLWDTYLINLKEQPLKNILISSKGYGNYNGDTVKTTTLRYFYEEISSLDFVKIEPIQAKLFGLTNEYWVSFYLGGELYDKKYIFVNGSIEPKNFTVIPFLDEQGVMIR